MKDLKIIYGGRPKGKSYSPFFIKHQLINKTDDEIKKRLQEIIDDLNFHEEEREQAKKILHYLGV